MKFKVGDIVVIRKDMVVDKNYGMLTAYRGMVSLGGNICTIVNVGNSYTVKENGYLWDPKMLVSGDDPNDNCRGDPNG